LKIQFNLATYKYENKRVTYPLFFFFLFITVLFTLYNLNKYDELQRDLEKSHQKIDYIKNNLAKKDLDKNNSKIDSKELSRLRTKIEFFNQLMNSMNFSYLGMLNYLEDNLPLGVRLKRLDLNIDKRSLSIAGETKSHEKMILFLENLEASNILVPLKNHRFAWGITLFLLIINFAIYITVIKEQTEELEKLKNEYFKKRNILAGKEKEGMKNNDNYYYHLVEESKKIREKFLHRKDFIKVIKEIFEIVEGNGFSLTKVNYQIKPVLKEKIYKYFISFSVNGKYSQLKKFIYQIENSPSFYSLNYISMNNSNEKEEVFLGLQLIVYLI
jgi:Tfp pilus assembly protein PilO